PPQMNRPLEWSKRQSPKSLSTIQRYGLAIFSVFAALGLALLMDRLNFRDAGIPLLLFALAVTAWYGRAGAAVLALLLSTMGFDYFFVAPYHTLYVVSSEVPYFIVFASFASLITWFSAIRRRAEEGLRQARDKLEIEVAERGRREQEVRALNEEL